MLRVRMGVGVLRVLCVVWSETNGVRRMDFVERGLTFIGIDILRLHLRNVLNVLLLQIKHPVLQCLHNGHVPGRLRDAVDVFWSSKGSHMRAEGRLVVVRAGRDVFVAAEKAAFPHALDLALKRIHLVFAA